MIEKSIKSLNSYINIIQKITSSPSNVLDILWENTKSTFKTINKAVQMAFFEQNEELEKKYLSIIFMEEFRRENDISNQDKAIIGMKVDGISPKLKFYYRGHYSDKYLLLPGAMRDCAECEDELYKEILTRNPNDFAQNGHMERLVKMQHYGLPTRLLDITSNPLVALYFACVNTGCEKCDSCPTGEVFVFAPFEKDILSFDSDKALILSCIPKFNIEEKKEILDICVSKIQNKEYTLREEEHAVIDRLYHEIRREVPAFKAIINPYHILSSFFIQPLKNNARIAKQDGAFIICGQYYDSGILEAKLNSLLVAKIKISNKPKILKELDALGINEATLFPELDKVAHYLKTRNNQ